MALVGFLVIPATRFGVLTTLPLVIGTDATIAQHIQTIIDRDYVIEKMDGATKHLIPSKLGIGLIEGYNQIGLNKSLSKPQLRREVRVLSCYVHARFVS